MGDRRGRDMAWAGAVSTLPVYFLGSLQIHQWLHFTTNNLHETFRRWDAGLSILSKLPRDWNVQAGAGGRTPVLGAEGWGTCIFPHIRAQACHHSHASKLHGSAILIHG